MRTVVVGVILAPLVACTQASPPVDRPASAPAADMGPAQGVVTQGVSPAPHPCAVTLECDTEGNIREALCGEVTADDGSEWAVPAPITDGATAVDVFNECRYGGANPDYESQLVTQVIDESGATVTAHLFGDNYFEFYANGAFVGRDGVGFTPFNSHAARVQAAYPITYAVLAVDWEGYLGVGLEDSQGRLHIGDAGFIATFDDGTAVHGTDDTWRCKAFYVAPLDDPGCVVFDDRGNPDSSSCPSSDETVACIGDDPTSTCRALHLPLPDDWMSPAFDDSGWEPATLYTADEVTNAPAFRDYEQTLFREGRFIWTSNLDLDNMVVCRRTVPPPG